MFDISRLMFVISLVHNGHREGHGGKPPSGSNGAAWRIGLSSLYGKAIKSFDYEISPTAGLHAGVSIFLKLLGIEIDVMYQNLSGDINVDVDPNDPFGTHETGAYAVNKITGHYIQIPLLLKLTVPTDGDAHPNFSFGARSFYSGSQRKSK